MTLNSMASVHLLHRASAAIRDGCRPV